jgi:hypothetical protein
MIDNETFSPHNTNLNCNNCKIKPADFICDSCGSLKYFCSSCDGYIHALSANRDHKRALIENTVTFRNTDYTSFKGTLNTSQELRSVYPTTPRYADTRDSRDDLSTNYIRDIKRTHDREKQELLTELEDMRGSLTYRIEQLQGQLEENNHRYMNNLRSMEDDFRFKMKSVIGDKDSEINILKKNIIDLEAMNKELFNRAEEYKYIIDNQKDDFDSRLSILDDDLKHCEGETTQLKSHYENRIAFLLDQFSQEKTKLKDDYERQIDK